MGTPAAAVPTLERILSDGHEVKAVYTQPDRPSGRGKRVTSSAVKEFALSHDLTVFQPVKIRTEEALAEFQSHDADAAVVVAYGRILPETFLTAFPKGAINVHFSLLPKYRGAAPVNWAIVHGETKTGVTTMRMDAGLDTGDILLQEETEIGPEETSAELMPRLADIGAGVLSKTLEELDSIVPRKQNELEATMAPIMRKEDGLISWMLDATQITNRVRGFQPFPTAFTFLGDKKVSIWKCRPVQVVRHPSALGEIINAHADDLVVYCGGDSGLKIEELQVEGKRRMSARDFINGAKPQVGEKFGA
jgi:methionyl-tRNA formyltransferase